MIMEFLTASPVLAIFLCLGIGYLLGGLRIKSFSIGATVGTLIVAFVLSMFGDFQIPGIVVNLFSVLFCFTIGYEAGPALFGSLKSSGIKLVLQAVFFAAVSLGVLWGVCSLMGYSRDVAVGMAAGAMTQTTILSVVSDLGANASMTYALTYLVGMLLNVLFHSKVAPRLLGTTARDAVKEKTDKLSRDGSGRAIRTTPTPVGMRAFIIDADSGLPGRTVAEIEAEFGNAIQVESIFRGKHQIPFDNDTVTADGDVLCVIGKMQRLASFDNKFELREAAESEYYTVDLSSETVVITKDFEGDLMAFLSERGVVVQALFRNGKRLKLSEGNEIRKGDTVRLSGVSKELKKAAAELGYIKDTGMATDVPYVFLAAAVGIALGAIKLFGIPLGDSTMALIVGLLVGWYYNKHPRFGRFPSSARWFLKSVGLNLFIAAKTLNTAGIIFNKDSLISIGTGAAVTLIPLVITLFFSKYVLKLDNADTLGGSCGSSTCTAALNSLTDATGSSVFSAGYATTNAVNNILLTVAGLVISLLVH